MHKPLCVEKQLAPSAAATEHHGKPALLRGTLELPINFPEEKENGKPSKTDAEAAAAEWHQGP